MPKFNISDIIPLEKFEHVLRTIAKSTEMNLCMVDLLGNVIIRPTNDIPFCKTARKDENRRQMCLRCATHAALDAAQSKRTFFYRCPYGLVDFAVPIFYRGEVLGAIFGGELRIDGCDENLDHVYPVITLDDNAELKKLLEDTQHSNLEKLTETAKLLSQLAENLENFGILMNLKNENGRPVYHNEKIQPALDYIEMNFYKPISLKELASICFVSEPYFSRFFKSVMNCNLSDYITNLRIKKAKELLKDPEIKLITVAYETGYNDYSYFNRKFKKATGMTPCEYRASHINSEN